MTTYKFVLRGHMKPDVAAFGACEEPRRGAGGKEGSLHLSIRQLSNYTSLHSNKSLWLP